MNNLHPYVRRKSRQESASYVDLKFQALQKFKNEAIRDFRRYLVEYDQSWRANRSEALDESKIAQFYAAWEALEEAISLNNQPIFQNPQRYYLRFP